MIQKKVCMLGALAVGKTSLVSRFVSGIFSEKYLTTVGVKIDKKSLSIDHREVDLLLWDVYGQDELHGVQQSYLRGSSGYLLVADGTRHATLQTARALQTSAEQVLGNVPFILVLNKTDLDSEWEVDERELQRFAEQGVAVVRTSAKTGAGVEETFLTLARAMVPD